MKNNKPAPAQHPTPATRQYQAAKWLLIAGLLIFQSSMVYLVWYRVDAELERLKKQKIKKLQNGATLQHQNITSWFFHKQLCFGTRPARTQGLGYFNCVPDCNRLTHICAASNRVVLDRLVYPALVQGPGFNIGFFLVRYSVDFCVKNTPGFIPMARFLKNSIFLRHSAAGGSCNFWLTKNEVEHSEDDYLVIPGLYSYSPAILKIKIFIA